MQDNFNRLVRLCFYGLLILIGFLLVGAQANSFGAPAVLGIALFLILLSMQFTSRAMKSKSAKESSGASLSGNKGGVITLVLIALIALFVVFKAFTA
ncbi:hypothetical protein AOB54_04350 [beta proteobacterium MWH-UniP1]